MKKLALALGLLTALSLTFAVFSPCLSNDFVNFDDPGYVQDNPDILGLTVKNVQKIFSNFYVGNYLPLTMLTYLLEHHAVGPNPFLYHLDNVLLHCGNVVLAFAFVYLLTGSPLAAFIAATLFGVHPLRVESVAWIAERKDVLFAFFYLAALIAYVFYVKKGHKRFHFACLLLFLLALAAKVQAISLPLALWSLDYLLLRRDPRRWNWLSEKIPFLALGAVWGILTISFQHRSEAFTDLSAYSTLERILMITGSIVLYLGKLVWPAHLAVVYPFPEKSAGMLPVIFYLSPLLLTVVGLSLVMLRKWSRLLQFAGLFFLSTFVVVLQYFPVGSFFMADRYSYLPGLGFSLLVAAVPGIVSRRWPNLWLQIKFALLLVFVLFLAGLGRATLRQCLVWQNSETLWNAQIASYPRFPGAYLLRGQFFHSQGDLKAALQDFNKVVELYPKNVAVYNNRGVLYAQRGQLDLAVEDFSRAVSLDPDYLSAYFNRGNAYRLQKKYDEALADFSRFLEHNPADEQGYLRRAQIHILKEAWDKAGDDFEKVLMINPRNAEALAYRGSLKFMKGDLTGALRDLDQAIMFDPRLYVAYNNRAVVHQALGHTSAAEADLSQAQQIMAREKPLPSSGRFCPLSQRGPF